MKIVLLMMSVLVCLNTHADPQFTNITSDDFENISKEMSANFIHNSLMGASKLGTIFGFQAGLVGAQTQTPKIDEIVKRNAGSLPNLYNVGLMGAIGLPFGISGEIVMIPSFKASGASLEAKSIAIKYNINDVIPVLPVNLALRGFYSQASFGFSQLVSAVNVDVTNKTTVSGVQILLSPMFPFIEPYIGVGLVNGSNVLSVTGSNPIFDPTFSSSQSEIKSVSSTQILAGAEVNLVLLKLGVEQSQSFGTSRTSFKLTLGF